MKLLADCERYIPTLAKLWFELIGQPWIPNASIENKKLAMQNDLNKKSLPLTYVAINDNEVLGMCSLREDDGLGKVRTPWLGSLIVHPDYQKQGIGEKLIKQIFATAKALGYQELFILVLDPTLPRWYHKLGFRKVGDDQLFHHPVTVMISPSF